MVPVGERREEPDHACDQHEHVQLDEGSHHEQHEQQGDHDPPWYRSASAGKNPITPATSTNTYSSTRGATTNSTNSRATMTLHGTGRRAPGRTRSRLRPARTRTARRGEPPRTARTAGRP